MNNEIVLLRALNSAPYLDAVSAIKLFLRATHKERVICGKLAAALQVSTEGQDDEKFTDTKGRDWYVGKKNTHEVSVATKSVAGTEIPTPFTCPKCGDQLIKSAICPACKDAQAGFKTKYSCVCGFELLGRQV